MTGRFAGAEAMNRRWTLRPFDPASAHQAALWRGLVQRAGGCAVLLPEFVFTCVETLARRPLILAVCGSADAPIAMALVDSARMMLPEVFVEDQMPLGAWVSLPGERFDELAAALVRALGMPLRLGIPQLDARFVPRPVATPALGTLDYMETAWLEIEGSFADYWAARGKNLKTNMRRQRDKLAAKGIAARMQVVTGPESMRQAVQDYAAIESKGWKAAGGTAVSAEHPQTQFYALMMERFSRLGMARVYQYLFDDRLVASELCLHDGREIVILKTTYDESVSPLSPTSLMRQEMFEELFSDGCTRRVEFYGPVKDWHTRWTPLRRQVFHVNVYRAPIFRRVETLIRRVGRPGPDTGRDAAAEPSAREDAEVRT